MTIEITDIAAAIIFRTNPARHTAVRSEGGRPSPRPVHPTGV